MSIVFIGAPGAGKTSVGEQVARALGRSFVDVDQRIEEVLDKPIRAIFADEGEEYFRAAEEEATLELLGSADIVSLGGGAIMNERIREALAGHEVIWLKVSAAQAARRVGMNKVRPLLLGNTRATLIALLAERAPYYAAVATQTVETDGRELAQIVEEIVEEHQA